MEHASGSGKTERRWLQTERHIDHAGLELYLRDVDPRPWVRVILRELVAFLAADRDGARITVPLDPKLDSEKKIRARLAQLGVRRWWSEI